MQAALLAIILASLSPQLSFTHYAAQEGFPQQQIRAIAQDYRGYILISAASETFSYDGYNVTRVEDLDNAYFMGNLPGGRVAAAIENTVKILSPSGLEVLQFDHKVRSVGTTSDGRLWIISTRGIYGYEQARQIFIPLPDGESAYCAEATAGKIYIGTTSGTLFSFDSQSERFTREHRFPERINVIHYDGKGALWVGTCRAGLYLWAAAEGIIENHSSDLCSSNVLSLCTDTDGVLWVGTLEGLNLIEGNKVTAAFRHDSDNGNSLSHNTIRRIFRDSQGGMWLGTFFGGTNYWHPSRKAVTNIIPGNTPYALNDPVASCIVESTDGLVWIGTNQGGVNCYDPVSGKVIAHYFLPTTGENRFGTNDIKAIWHHPDGRRVFIGAYGNGLNVLDRRTGSVRHLQSPMSVIRIVPLDENRLLLSSYGSSFSLYDINTGHWETRTDVGDPVLFKTSRGTIYSADSLKRISAGDDGRPVFSDPLFPSADIVSICEAADSSAVYFATDNGIYRRDSRTGNTEKLETPSDFPDIVGLIVDAEGDLWITTTSGLYCRNKGTFYRFSKAYGLATDVYSRYSLMRASTGKMYFGGVGGISILDPQALKQTVECPKPKVIAVSVSGSGLGSSAEYELRHPDRNISISFSSPDYSATGTDLFEYCLEGVDEGWRRAGIEHKAEYSYLPRGRFVFKLRVSRQGDVWTTNSEALRIRVRPAWYATIAAIIVWISLFLAAISFYLLLFFKRKEAENKLALHNLEKKYVREISKLKILRLLNSSVPEGGKIVEDISFDQERFLTRAMNMVEINIDRPDYSTDDLAVGLAISRSTLHKYMKAATGDSALTFIHKIRFAKACELLDNNKLTISEICYKTGFSSPSYFSASFRKFMGCSPQEYQKRRSQSPMDKF